jgi:hypothetical protein
MCFQFESADIIDWKSIRRSTSEKTGHCFDFTLTVSSRLCFKKRSVCCARTVQEPNALKRLGLALSEKQIPQVVGNIERPNE